MATLDAEAVSESRLEAVARVLVPVGMGLLTWLVFLLAVGAAGSLSSLSVMSVVLLVAFGLLALPVYRFRPWESGLTDRVLAFARTRRLTLAFAVGLFVLVRLPFVAELLGPLLTILLLPLRAAPQVLFGANVFYADLFGETVGQAVFRAGRLYVEFLWLYTVGTVGATVVRWGDPS